MEIKAAADAVPAMAALVTALVSPGVTDGFDVTFANALLADPLLADSACADPLHWRAGQCLEALAEVARLEARTAALKVRLAASYAEASRYLLSPSASRKEQSAVEMDILAEVACVLTISEGAAGAFLDQTQHLTAALPLTLAAMQAGSLSWQHARILCDETTDLSTSAAAALEAHFLDAEAPHAARGCPAGELVPSRFRAKARSWRERHHPVSIERRHCKSVQDRRLEYTPDRDGMAWLSAYVPTDTAAGIWDRATAAARALQGPNEPRTLTQLRTDVAASWMLAGTVAGIPSPAAQVLITVPVFSLMGLGTEPATLDGYGPIPPSMARRLVAESQGSFLRVLTDPYTGVPLEIGRTSYRVPKKMRQWLRLRDGRCPFPGCNNLSGDNEADHILAWDQGGTTGVSNLGLPCRKHHRLKHSTRWTPFGAARDKPPGWVSPMGRHYSSEEQDWEPAKWPEEWPEERPDERLDEWPGRTPIAGTRIDADARLHPKRQDDRTSHMDPDSQMDPVDPHIVCLIPDDAASHGRPEESASQEEDASPEEMDRHFSVPAQLSDVAQLTDLAQHNPDPVGPTDPWQDWYAA